MSPDPDATFSTGTGSTMTLPVSRRTFLRTAAASSVPATVGASTIHRDGRLVGRMTGAEAVVEALRIEGADCVFGIPGAQENELWDALKARRFPYLLVTHEFSASMMADGYARSSGRPGVLAVVPGPGLTNALSGIGEAFLDNVPLVCLVGDVARGERYRPYQVHDLPHAAMLRPLTKEVVEVSSSRDLPAAVRHAFGVARSGAPGPAAVLIPYDLLLEQYEYDVPPPCPEPMPLDEAAAEQAMALLADPSLRVGVHAGLGCMDHGPALVELAETLQAPVSTSVSGKGAIPEDHPLSVGWGYGPQGTRTAEAIFRQVDLVLAVGVRFSEFSTGFYAIPPRPHLIHVDVDRQALGAVMPADVCVQADAGLFFDWLLARADRIRRPANHALRCRIAQLRGREDEVNRKVFARCGADPMVFLRTLRQLTEPEALVYVDVSVSEHWAAETFQARLPRSYFQPTNNQAMGWSIPAAIGAQFGWPGRQTVTITGDGCLLMSAMEISTAARERLPVKFFVLDDQAYEYMQRLQKPAFRRTTATVLARIDYPALATALGVGYNEILSTDQLEAGIRGSLAQEGPVLTRVRVDYGDRPVRFIQAVSDRFIDQLSTGQKVRFLSRIASRSLNPQPKND